MDEQVSLKSENFQYHIAKAEEYIVRKDFDSARVEVESALMYNSFKNSIRDPHFKALVRKLSENFSSSKGKAAGTYFEKAKELAEKEELFAAIQPALLATLYSPGKKKYKDFLTELLNQKKAEDLMKKGMELKEVGSFKEALELLKKGSELRSKRLSFRKIIKDTILLKEEYELHLRAGVKFMKGEKYSRAKDEISKAAKMCPNLKKLQRILKDVEKKENAYNYYVVALRFYRQGEKIEAAKNLDMALNLSTNLSAAKILMKKIRLESIVNSYDISQIPLNSDMDVLSETIGMLEETIEERPSSPYFNKLFSNRKFKVN